MDQRTLNYDLLAFQLIRLIDQGSATSIAEVKRRIDSGSLFVYLENDLRADMSYYGPDQRETMLAEFRAMAHEADEQRKFDIARNGLALCLAYCVQAMANALAPQRLA